MTSPKPTTRISGAQSPNQNRENQRVHRVRSGRVRCPGGQAAPEMNRDDTLGQIDHVDQRVVELGVPVDRFVYRPMQGHDLVDTADVVSEAVDEGCIRGEQAREKIHVVGIPGRLKGGWQIFRRRDRGHESTASTAAPAIPSRVCTK